MDSLVQLPRILCQEEKEAFSKTTDGTDLDLITKLHNVSVYTKSLCHITEVMSGPLIQALENRLETNRSRIQTLQARKLDIEKQLKEIDNS
ncbi:BRCA1/BRCA2-containing complex subunit 3 [Mytilus galloprovincialis]|uniref:BRCA1/BRCA2-containing complex subunit 3 n=2 Tax=Mytilus TaxID=6548 RepID=A0A8B6EQD8_MYTGA|nr:BRCA1/BRCA2-containing complex subunit 3 [Mytilus galloprovincialis]